MLKYTIKRILALIPVMLVLSFLVYWIMSTAGDPVLTILGEEATQAEIEAMREQMGLNDPIYVRYFHYLTDVLHGDFGTGLYGNSVWEEFAVRIPYTLALACAGMVVTIVCSIPFGIIAAVKQNSWVDTGVSAVAMFGVSVPSFWLGLLLMLLFGVKLKWLPTSGADSFAAIIMPAICVGIQNAALIARTTRSSMVDNLRADYLRTARAKGVSENRVVLKHALGNGLIPIITLVGSQFSILMGGTVIVETVFAWPGVGAHLVSAIRSNDYTMVTSFIILLTVFVAGVLLVVDILYAFVDPRIKARYTRK